MVKNYRLFRPVGSQLDHLDNTYFGNVEFVKMASNMDSINMTDATNKDKIVSILRRIGLENLIEKFLEESINMETVAALSDEQLVLLGVTTIDENNI